MERDYIPRMTFCHWLLQQKDADQQFTSHILWSDESKFRRDGVVNVHNTHSWSVNNPYVIRETHFQERWSLNVWAGIVGNQIIGPHFLPDNLTGASHLRFLLDDLPGLLEDMPLSTRQNLIFEHDGASPHFSRYVKNLLNQRYNC